GRVADGGVRGAGGAGGIGLAIVRAFAGLGDRVAVHHRDWAGLAAEIVATLPGSGHAVVQADLTDPAAARRAVDQAHDALGGLDVLVNNAGVYREHDITRASYDEWQAAGRGTRGGHLPGAGHVARVRRQRTCAPGRARDID